MAADEKHSALVFADRRKIRLKNHLRIDHWWHVTFYVSPRGLTTRAIPYAGGRFEIEFDFKDHELKMRTNDGRVEDYAVICEIIASM